MRVVFIGTGEIGVPVLRWLLGAREHELAGVVTQPDKPAGRDQRLQAPPIKASFSDLSSIPLFQPDRIKGAAAELRALQPDVAVVMAYGQILPRAVLEIPRVACLNLHASLLPRHRGAAPIQAAIAAGDRETGITVMYMNEGLDTGDILSQSRLLIAPGETGGSLHDRLGEIAPAALAEALQQLEAGTAPRIPQDSAGATYAPKLEREHGRIDWTEPAEILERKIRAFNPWPGAFTIFRDDLGSEYKVKIFVAAVIGSESSAPGDIILGSGESLVVAAREGALSLREVQLEGKKRMKAGDFVRGHPWVARAAVVA
jgi:methionyl-tRNA formyltransferase